MAHIPDYVIVVEIPALDRLVNYLEKQDQSKVDALAEVVKQFTGRLKLSSGRLKAAVQTVR